MKTNIIILLIIFATTSNILCDEPVQTKPNLDGYQVFTWGKTVRENNEASLTAEVGKNIVIRIKSNPTTGYQIFLDNKPTELESTGIVKPLNLNAEGGSDEYLVDPHPKGMVGVPGFSYFKFATLKKGEIKLKFVSKQSWNPESAVTLSVNLTVV